jgi:hypothetical protein
VEADADARKRKPVRAELEWDYVKVFFKFSATCSKARQELTETEGE